jgi:hypothetical protein
VALGHACPIAARDVMEKRRTDELVSGPAEVLREVIVHEHEHPGTYHPERENAVIHAAISITLQDGVAAARS